MKTKITSEFLLKEYRNTTKTILFAVFVVVGLFCFICPVFYCKELANLIANMAFMLIIAIPFCFVGLKNIINIIKTSNSIKSSNYTILKDVVVEKQMLHHGASKDTSDSYCQLDFENHSKSTGKAVVVKRSVYEETKKGDSFYLVYVNNKLIGFYPTEKYSIIERK